MPHATAARPDAANRIVTGDASTANVELRECRGPRACVFGVRVFARPRSGVTRTTRAGRGSAHTRYSRAGSRDLRQRRKVAARHDPRDERSKGAFMDCPPCDGGCTPCAYAESCWWLASRATPRITGSFQRKCNAALWAHQSLRTVSRVLRAHIPLPPTNGDPEATAMRRASAASKRAPIERMPQWLRRDVSGVSAKRRGYPRATPTEHGSGSHERAAMIAG